MQPQRLTSNVGPDRSLYGGQDEPPGQNKLDAPGGARGSKSCSRDGFHVKCKIESSGWSPNGGVSQLIGNNKDVRSRQPQLSYKGFHTVRRMLI